MGLAARDTELASELQGEVAWLKEPLVLIIGIAPGRIPDAIARVVRLFWFEEVRDDKALLLDAEGRRIEAREMPPWALAILTEPQAKGQEAALLDWLERGGARELPPLVEWNDEAALDVLSILFGGLSEALVASARRLVATNSELLTLRRTNEDMQNRFQAVEAFLSGRNLQPVDLTFLNEPDADPSRPNILVEFGGQGIRQILPVASSGVSAVALHFAELPKGSGAQLDVELVTLENQRTVERWLVPVRDLVPGWNVFGLGRTLSGFRRTLELRLRVAKGVRLPVLSLGGLQPLDLFQIRDSGDAPLRPNSLAMQVWCGLSGVVLPSWPGLLPALSSPPPENGGFREASVPNALLKTAAQVNGDEGALDFPAIQAKPADGSILCHPPVQGMTVGFLRSVIPPGTVRISAHAYIVHEKADDVDFAVAVAGDPRRARDLLEGKREPADGEAVSGWTRVAYGDEASLNAFLAQPVKDWESIYLATRMTNPGANSFARARFRGITALVRE